MGFEDMVTVPYLLTQVHGAQLGRLHFGIHHHVEHGANGLRHTEVRGPTAPLELDLKCRPGPLDKQTQPSPHLIDLNHI